MVYLSNKMKSKLSASPETALRVNCGVKKIDRQSNNVNKNNYISVTLQEKLDKESQQKKLAEEQRERDLKRDQHAEDENIGYELRISVQDAKEAEESSQTGIADETPSPRDFFISEDMLQRAKEVVAEHVIGVINNLTKQKYSIEDFEKLYEAVYHTTTSEGSDELKRRRLKKLIMYCELRDFHDQLHREPQPILNNFVQHCPLSEDIVNSPRKSRIIALIQSALMLMTKQVGREIRTLEAKRG